MNLSDISTQLLFTTVPIWTQGPDGTQGVGTGFFYAVPVAGTEDQQVPLLVTNRHVIAQGQRGMTELVEGTDGKPQKGSRIRVEFDPQDFLKHSNEALDLAAIPVGGVLNQLQAAGREVFFRSVSPDLVPTEEAIEELAALEDITFIGYPSGLYDEHNVTPIIRRGITATPPWNDFQGDPAFLIDAGVFPGSSGSPVFILNQGAYPTRDGLTVGSRLLFLGVVTETFVQSSDRVSGVYLGLGKVVKSREAVAFLGEVAADLQRTNAV